MNLFRSEEHVRRWSLYYHVAEDYIMPVSDWARVFSAPTFRNRLDPDYLEHASDYLEEYHQALKDMGKISPFWQYPFIARLEEVRLSRFRVVGSYTRYEQPVLNALKDAKENILAGLEHRSKMRENHLIWAAPGSGKTFFVQEIANSLAEICQYVEINLAKVGEVEFRLALEGLISETQPAICLIDEIDAKPDASWPYEVLLPFLDATLEQDKHIVYVMAGSSGFSLEGMKQRIESRPKGRDFLSRVPAENQYVIPQMSFGDRVLVVLSQFVRAGKKVGREIHAVEKLGLYYIALNSRLTNARQLYEFTIRAVERGAHSDDRIKYDQLFAPGDPENKRFWLEVSSVPSELVNSYVLVEE